MKKYNGKNMYSLQDYIRVEICNNQKMHFFRIIKAIILNPSCNAIFLVRLYQILKKKKGCKILALWVRNSLIHKYGIFIGERTMIDIGLKLPHPCGIIFGDSVMIGKNATVYQQVTFGAKNHGDAQKAKYPRVGDNGTFFAGAKIIGDIRISNNTTVGANSVLLSDTEENSIYVGIPARRIK